MVHQRASITTGFLFDGQVPMGGLVELERAGCREGRLGDEEEGSGEECFEMHC